jgi:ATP:cob(I)alamin adenosyltransferase
MGIVTKTGDDGKTGLWSGERVWKDDARVEAYGTVDELSSFIGLAKHSARVAEVRSCIEGVQKDLVRLASDLASKGKPSGNPILPEDGERLSALVTALEQRIPLCGFVILGMTEASARLDVARAVCRRAERRIVSLSRAEEVPAPVGPYLNRLSDLLFMLARVEEEAMGALCYA